MICKTMITSKKEKSSNPKDEISFDLISIRMSELMKSPNKKEKNIIYLYEK